MTSTLGRNVCKEIRGEEWPREVRGAVVREVGGKIWREVGDAIWLEVGNEARGEVSKKLCRLTGRSV